MIDMSLEPEFMIVPLKSPGASLSPMVKVTSTVPLSLSMVPLPLRPLIVSSFIMPK
jgi:hypothetical protein